MKTRTHTISKTKVEEVKFIIERCAEAEVWVDAYDALARIRVDNTSISPANLLTVESPRRDYEIDPYKYEIPCVKIDTDTFLRIDGPLKVQAVWHDDYKLNTMNIKAVMEQEGATQ